MMASHVRHTVLVWFPAFVLASLPPASASAQTFPIQGTQIDVDNYGNMYVLDRERNALRMFDKAGTMKREVGGPGWLDGQFDRPSGICARNGIDVFVADYGNHRIERFDRSLDFVSSFSTRGSDNPDEQFGYPGGVAISRQGELFICDTENSRIVKVDRFSQVERTFGGFGGGRGRLGAPSAVSVGPADAVYVVDAARVAVFDAFGNYLRDLVPGLFTHPAALYADNDCVVVLDGETLFMFDADERPSGAFPLNTLAPSAAALRGIAAQGGKLYLLAASGLFVLPDPRTGRGAEHLK